MVVSLQLCLFCPVSQLLSTLNHSRRCASAEKATQELVCKHVFPGLAGEISVISELLHHNSLETRSWYRFFQVLVSFCTLLLLNLPEFILFHL